MGFFRRFRTLAEDRRRRLAGEKRDRGATAVEYGLILALFGIGMIGVSSVLFGAIKTTMGVQSTNVGNTVAVAVTPPATITGTPACNPGAVWDGSNCVAICPTYQWYNSSTGACDAIPVCGTGTTYNGTTNTCVPLSTATPTPTPTVTPTPTPTTTAAGCGPGGWFDGSSGNCEPKLTCTGATPNWNPFTNTCYSGSQTTVNNCVTSGGALVGSTCVTQANCIASSGAGAQTGIWVAGSPAQCVTQTTCNSGGGVWIGSPRQCINQATCINTMTGIWTAQNGGTPASCTTQAICQASATTAWVASPRSCVNQTTCTGGTLNGEWTAGTPNTCVTQTTCNAASNAWMSGAKTCVTQAQCIATSGTKAQTGAWFTGNPPSCVTQAICTAAGNAWDGTTTPRQCITSGMCTTSMVGIWTPAGGGTPASCVTQATCNAGGKAWIASPRSCFDQAACTASNRFWQAGSPPNCAFGPVCTVATQVPVAPPSTACQDIPLLTANQSMGARNTSKTFDVLTNATYKAAPYTVVSVTATCSTTRGAVTCPNPTPPSTSVVVTTSGIGTGLTATVSLTYTVTISWYTAAGTTDTSSRTFTLSISAP